MDIQSHPLYGAFYALAGEPRTDGGAKIVTMTSPFTGSGTSYVARELARLAAGFYHSQGFRVALIDYDLKQQSQAAYYSEPEKQTRHGALLGPFDLTFGEIPFWQVSPSVVDETGQRVASGTYAGGYLIGESGLLISKFDWSQMRSGQQVHTRNVPEYWNRLRREFALIIIDTPALDRGDIAVDLYPVSDTCAIIADPVQAGSAAVTDLGNRISSLSGHCAGVIVNEGRVQSDVMMPPSSAEPGL